MKPVIRVNSVKNSFQAYMNGGNIVVNVSNIPGNYTLSLADMNGSLLAARNFHVDKQSVQITMEPPVKRTGIYMVNLKGGDGINESIKLFIQR